MSESSSWKWESLLALIFNWWPFVFLPLGYALFAALAAAQEKNPVITVLCVPAISILWHSGSIRSQLWLSLACFPLLSSWLRLSRRPAYKCGSPALREDFYSRHGLLALFPHTDSHPAMGCCVEGIISQYGNRIPGYDHRSPGSANVFLDGSSLELGHKNDVSPDRCTSKRHPFTCR